MPCSQPSIRSRAKLLGGTGAYSGLFAGFSFAFVPLAIGVPFIFLPMILGLGELLLWLLLQLGLLSWVGVLAGIVIRENNGLSTARATAAFLIPQVVASVLFILAFVLLIILVVTSLNFT